MRGGRCASQVRSAREQYRSVLAKQQAGSKNNSSWSWSVDQEGTPADRLNRHRSVVKPTTKTATTTATSSDSKPTSKSARGGALAGGGRSVRIASTTIGAKMNNDGSNGDSGDLAKRRSVPRDMASFAETPDGGGFNSTLRRKKQTDSTKNLTRVSNSPARPKLEHTKRPTLTSNQVKTRPSASPIRNHVSPQRPQQLSRPKSAIVNHIHINSNNTLASRNDSTLGTSVSSGSSMTPSNPNSPTSPYGGPPSPHRGPPSPWSGSSPKYTQNYIYERYERQERLEKQDRPEKQERVEMHKLEKQERLSAPRHAYLSSSVPTKKISVQTGDELLYDGNVIEDAQPELEQSPEVKEFPSKKTSAAPSVRRAKSSIDEKLLQEARKKQRRNTVFVKSSIGMDLIKKVDLEEVYDVYKQLGTGRFGYVQLAEHKQSKLKIALKFFPRPQIKQADFVREYNYSYFLSPHPNIIDTYEGMYQTHDESAFFFVQEFCPSASLREAVERSPGGLTEEITRNILSRVLSAIEFMHSENLVHRNLKAENILLFDIENYSRVKITDFGLTRKVDSTVKYLEYVNCYHAPELCETVVNEVLTVSKSLDIWALGIIFYYCLKGKFPWQKASIMCKPFWEWEQWLKRKSPQLPKRWEPFSEKSLKLLKRCLNPKAKDRWTVKEMKKVIAKEKLLKIQKVKRSDSMKKKIKQDTFDDHFVYLDEENTVKSYSTLPKISKKKSAISNWINNTWATMSEISEQVVSAQD